MRLVVVKRTIQQQRFQYVRVVRDKLVKNGIHLKTEHI